MRVFWSGRALTDYHNNIDYLLKEWGNSPAKNFIHDVDITLDLIRRFPRLYPFIGHKKIQKAIVNSNITLYFEVHTHEVRIYRLWNNRQDPKNLKF